MSAPSKLRPDHFENLATPDVELLDGPRGLNLVCQPEVLEVLAGLELETRFIDEPVPTRLSPQHQVVRDREARDEGRPLANHGDSGAASARLRRQLLQSSLDEDLSGGVARTLDPRENLQQGGLAAPVLAAQSDELPAVDRQVRPMQGLRRAHRFDADKLEKRGGAGPQGRGGLGA